MFVPGAFFSNLWSVQRLLFDNDGAPDTSSELQQDLEILNQEDDENVDDVDEETEEVDLEDPDRTPEKKRQKKDRGQAEPEESDEEDSEEEDDEEEDESEDEEDDEQEDEEEDDEEEDDQEDKEEQDKDKSKKPPVQGRPTVKDIKERVPDLFKQLPGLRPIYFEHEKFQKVFATPEIAEEGARKAGEYDFLESTLVQEEDPEPLFETLAQNNPKAFKAMVMKIPEALEKVDRNTFLEFTEPILERFVHSMAMHAKKTGDVNLAKVARHCANFAFANGGEIPDPAKRKGDPRQSEAELRLQQERDQYAQREHRRAVGQVSGRIDTLIREIALEGVPRDTSDFIKRGLIRDLRAQADQELAKDKAFGQHMAGLWRKARTAHYTDESAEGIYQAWTSRAKPLLKDVARRLRHEALGKKVKPRVREDAENREGNERPRKKVFNSSKKTSGKVARRQVLDPTKIDYRRTSDMDILEDRIKLKGQR